MMKILINRLLPIKIKLRELINKRDSLNNNKELRGLK
jgi:hypothetical protein